MQQSEPTEHSVRLSARLRAETEGAHQRLDSQTVLAALMQPDLTSPLYGQSLYCLYYAWAPAELAIERLLRDHATDPAVATLAPFHFPRRQALAADLAELAWPVPESREWQWTGNTDRPLATLAGQLYVMAGGQLGSVLIERKVSAVNPAFPIRFFQARPADLGQRWAGFRACLDAMFISPETHALVIESANLSFLHFIERLNEASRSLQMSAS